MGIVKVYYQFTTTKAPDRTLYVYNCFDFDHS
jgi:hypothetical protein